MSCVGVSYFRPQHVKGTAVLQVQRNSNRGSRKGQTRAEPSDPLREKTLFFTGATSEAKHREAGSAQTKNKQRVKVKVRLYSGDDL